MRGFVYALFLWLLGAVSAAAEANVVLFERAPLRPGLCAALRIQLSGSAEVRCVADGKLEALAERLAEARARLRAENGSLGVLLERDSDPRLLRMYLVSGQGEQAALAIERIEDRPEPDVDRSLAIKVRDACEVIAFVDRALPNSTASTTAVLAKPAAQVAVAPPRQPEQSALAVTQAFWLSFLELGGGLSLGDGVRAFGSALLGVGRASTRLRYELALGARLSSRQREKSAGVGSVSVSERGPLLAARLTWRFGRVELGAELHGLLVFSEAEGITADGTQRGRSSVVTFVPGLGPDLRVRLFHFAYLRFAPSFELWTTRQRFAVDDQVVLDRGYLDVSLPLSLMINLPLAKTPEGFQP